MAATLVGRRVSNAVSQGRCLVPWISSSSASSSMFRLHVLSGKPKSAPVSDALGQCPCVNLSKYVVERYLGLFMQPWWPPLRRALSAASPTLQTSHRRKGAEL